MKAVRRSRWALQVLASILLLAWGAGGQARAVTLGFDDIDFTGAPEPNRKPMPAGYGGFNWNNFWVMDAVYFSGNPSGYLNGMASPRNVLYNAWGNPAAVSDGLFDFVGCDLTAAWRTGLNIDVLGFRAGAQVYSTTVVVDCTSPTWFTFNYQQIDELRFQSYGGVHYPPYAAGDGPHLVLDDFTYVPEPATLALLTAGGLALGCRRKGRQLA